MSTPEWLDIVTPSERTTRHRQCCRAKINSSTQLLLFVFSWPSTTNGGDAFRVQLKTTRDHKYRRKPNSQNSPLSKIVVVENTLTDFYDFVSCTYTASTENIVKHFACYSVFLQSHKVISWQKNEDLLLNAVHASNIPSPNIQTEHIKNWISNRYKMT